MKISRHAAVRSQQRGIPPIVIDLLLQFGVTEKAPGGTSKRFLDKRGRRQIEAYVGPMFRTFAEHLDAYVVIGNDEEVITVASRGERIKRH